MRSFGRPIIFPFDHATSHYGLNIILNELN